MAILLGLLSSLKETGLDVTLQVCFFDQEEVGLIGSAVYAREHGDPQRHLAMINLDVVGFGSELFVGPVGEGDDDLVAPLITDLAIEHGVDWKIASLYPPSDNLSFAHEGLENISVAIVPAGDSQRVQRMLNGKMTDETMPIVMKTMHTPKDGVDTIDPEAMMKVYTIVREAVLRIEERN